MHIESIEGIVLKKTMYQDHKMIVNFFTEKYGLITLSVPLSKKKAHHLGIFEVGTLAIIDVDKEKHPFKFKEASVQYFPHLIRSKLPTLTAFFTLFSYLNQILAPELPIPPFYKLVKNSLKAFEATLYPQSLTLFILIKWMQLESILPQSQNPLINTQLQHLLTLKNFDQLDVFENAFKEFILDALKQGSCLHA